MRTRDATILFVPGLGGSGPDHWQSRWQARLPTARRVEQASWTHPERGAWTFAIAAAIAAVPQPVVVIAHSLGVIAFAQAVIGGVGPVAGAFLVTPPGADIVLGIPEIDPAFVPYPTAPMPCPTVLVGSRTDPYGTAGQAEDLALDWGAQYVDAGEAGHINPASGHGPWPEGLMSFAGFLGKLT